VSSGTRLPRPVTAREQRVCPLCGGELCFSHREYLGGRRSARVLRCRACGAQVRGEPQDDDSRPRSQPPARRRPLPEGGQPDNFVLDPDTAARLRQMLEGETAGPET
jgi:hypothetical protein